MVGGLVRRDVCLRETRVAGKRAILIIGVERLKGIRDILWHKLLLLLIGERLIAGF